MDAIIALRDETFFQGWPILLLAEPRSGMIFFGHVAADRTAETWATALLFPCDQNLSITPNLLLIDTIIEKILYLEETLSLLIDQDEAGMQLCKLLMENLDSVPRASR